MDGNSHNGNTHNGNTTGNRNISLGSGNTITAPISVPVNVCGNAVAALGTIGVGAGIVAVARRRRNSED